MTIASGPVWVSLCCFAIALGATASRFRPLGRARRAPASGSGTPNRRTRSNSVSALRLRLERRQPVVTRRRIAGPGDIAQWIDDVSRSVGHGRTLRHSLLDVLPTAPRVALITAPLRHALDRGATVADACARWIARCDAIDPVERRRLAMTSSILSVTSTVGGSVAQPLDRLAAALRAAAADDLEREAQTAQARISVRVLTLVPFAVLALLLTLDGDVRGVCSTPTGLALVGGGIALNLAGAWWMRKVIDGGSP